MAAQNITPTASTTTISSPSCPLAQPSLFDLLAADSLLQTTRPAIKKLLHSLASLGNGGAGGGEFQRWLRRWGDEVSLVLELGLHYYFLKRHGASFAENFYGMRRIEATTGGGAPTGPEGASGLSRCAVFKSLVVVALLPYAKKKAGELFDRLSRMEADGELEEAPGRRWIKAFLAVYPILSICSQSSAVLYHLLYALGKSKFHDPLEHLVGGFFLSFPPPTLSSMPSKDDASLVKSTMTSLLNMSGRLLSHTFSVGLFFVQFFDVFDVEGRGGTGTGTGSGQLSSLSSEMDDYSRRILKKLDAVISPPKMMTSLTTLMSPSTPLISPNDVYADRTEITSSAVSSVSWTPRNKRSSNGDQNSSAASYFDVGGGGAGGDSLCPLCERRRENETALSVSGFVFCYKCIVDYLKSHGVCPVTRLPAKINNLVRLYPGY